MTKEFGFNPRVLATMLVVLFLTAGVCMGAQATGTQPNQANTPVAKVNINKAPVEKLQQLPGIGPAIARRIVEYREEHGPFKRIEELMNVRGIGARKFARLRERITV